MMYTADCPNTEGRTDASSGELDSRDLLTKVHNAPEPKHAELRFQNGHHHTNHALAFHIHHEQLVVIVKGPTFPSRNATLFVGQNDLGAVRAVQTHPRAYDHVSFVQGHPHCVIGSVFIDRISCQHIFSSDETDCSTLTIFGQ